MTTILDNIDEYHNHEEEPIPTKKQDAITVLSPNIIPSSTVHSKVIANATKNDKKTLRLSAAANPNKTVGQVNLYSEKRFIEEMQKKGIEVYDGLEDPLNDKEKEQLHENFRREGATRRSLSFLAQFILGERTKIVMDVVEGFADPEDEEQAIKLLNDNMEYRAILNEIATIDKNVNLYNRLKDLEIAGHNYGRSILVKQYDADGIPNRLVPLWSLRLGKVYVNKETHELLGCEYKDYEGEERILKAEDIIYFTVDDYPISPNSRWFGLPPTETTMATATSNRITQEVAIAEVVKRMWAKARIIKAPGIQGQSKLDAFAQLLLPGKDIITNQENIMIETLDLDADIMKLIESVEEREKKIFRDLTIPLIVGFQEDQPMATAQASLHQWTVSVLKDKRTDLKNIIEEQWYKPILKAILKRRQSQIQEEVPLQQPEETQTPSETAADSLSPDNPLGQTPLEIPTTQRSPMSPFDERQPVIQEQPVVTQIDPENPPFKIKMTFDNIIFDTFLEKAAAVLGFLQAGAITKEIALEIAGLEQYIERMKAEEAAREEKKALGQMVEGESPDLDTTIEPQAVGGEPSVNLPNLPIAARQGASSFLDNAGKLRVENLRRIIEGQLQQQVKQEREAIAKKKARKSKGKK